MFSFGSYAALAVERINEEYRDIHPEYVRGWELHINWRCEWALEEVDEFDPRAVIAALREELANQIEDPFSGNVFPEVLPVIFNVYASNIVRESERWWELEERGELTTNAAAIVETIKEETYGYLAWAAEQLALELEVVVNDLEREWLTTN